MHYVIHIQQVFCSSCSVNPVCGSLYVNSLLSDLHDVGDNSINLFCLTCMAFLYIACKMLYKYYIEL